tara:strand:- start:6907 stop:7065 length:159 start_codon:yes stop_codon:yes gene_type:complete
MKLTEKQILHILRNNLINKCNEKEKAQVYVYAFGEEFMASNDKGVLKTYKEL